jgi:spore coat polysaccharide biosynthesis protein SpsF
MEVGQFKVGAIIQARLGSTRLPNKVLLKLPFGSNRTILDHIFESLNSSTYQIKTVLATSDNEINDKLYEFSKSRDVICYRGDEENVLSRFYEVAKEQKLDIIIRLTGDNPILDTSYLDKALNHLIINKLEYLYTKGLPLGCNFEIMSFNALESAFNNAESTYEKEHVTPFIKKLKIKKDILFLSFEGNENLRLTIDYPSDYALMNLIFSSIEKPSLKEISLFFEKNKWLMEINSGNYQKKDYDSLEEEIEVITPLLKKMELYRVIKKIKTN